MIIKTGIVRTEKAANIMLFLIGIVLLLIAFYVYGANGTSEADLKPVPNDAWPKAQGE